MTVGVLVPRIGADPGHPAERPIGRAALRLEAEGTAVLLGSTATDGVLHGVRAHPDGWLADAAPVTGIYDRFPSRSRAEEHAALQRALPGVRWVNDPAIVELCADKAACQAWLEPAVPMPEVEIDPDRFAERLDGWGLAFAKPRYGAFGSGVERVSRGSAVAHDRPGSIAGALDPTILQRAVRPPPGFAGIALRVLVQRTVDGGFVTAPAVVRSSVDDPVVNAARGAEVSDARGRREVDEPRARALARRAAERIAEAPGGEGLVELGVDLVVDDEYVPHVIEVNSRPRGRLEVLATLDPARYRKLHLEACARPLRWLAAHPE